MTIPQLVRFARRQLKPLTWIVTTVVLVPATWGLGAESSTSAVRWHGDLGQAWQSTQQQNRPLLVFVTSSNCPACVRMKNQTYTDTMVAATINGGFVPLVIDSASGSPLLKELGVAAFPATFVISRQAVVLDRINGYVPPHVLNARLAQLQAGLARPVPARKTPASPVSAGPPAF